MAEEKKPNTFKDKATIVKFKKTDAEAKPVVKDPNMIDIRRVKADGVELNRQCHKNDLVEFRARGFKPVEEIALEAELAEEAEREKKPATVQTK